MVWYSTVWYDMVVMVCYGTYGVVWYGMVCVVGIVLYCIVLYCMEEGAGGGWEGGTERVFWENKNPTQDVGKKVVQLVSCDCVRATFFHNREQNCVYVYATVQNYCTPCSSSCCTKDFRDKMFESKVMCWNAGAASA